MAKDWDSELSKSKISDRDKKEFDRLFTTYFVKLCKYAYGYVSNVDVARDLTQSVFLKIWELNGQWNPKGTIKSYLYVAVKNQCLNHIKHSKIAKEWKNSQEGEEPRITAENAWDEKEREELLNRAITDALDKMPDRRREIFELSRNEGLTYREIAEIKGISKKTVENHMGRAIKFLKRELRQWID